MRMRSDLDIAELRDALAAAAERTAQLIRNASDTSTPVPGLTWTVGETAAHLVGGASAYAGFYVPQAQVLDHASLVVCHGGSGTMLASLSAGLPIVALPQGADQFVNPPQCGNAGRRRTYSESHRRHAVPVGVSRRCPGAGEALKDAPQARDGDHP